MELQDILKKYPEFFPNSEKSVFCGISVGDGWKKLIIETIDKISCELYKYRNNKARPKFMFEQIKEKFGSLVMYYVLENSNETLDDDIENIMDEMQNKSIKICEACGKDGKIRNDMWWIRTLCDDCYSKREKEI
jgi:hypothetical protein